MVVSGVFVYLETDHRESFIYNLKLFQYNARLIYVARKSVSVFLPSWLGFHLLNLPIIYYAFRIDVEVFWYWGLFCIFNILLIFLLFDE